MSSPPITQDVVSAILGIDESSAVARLRNQKPENVAHLQAYYLSLFEPEEASVEAFPVADRALVAIRVASHTGSVAVKNWYRQLAVSAGATEEDIERAGNLENAWADDSRIGAAIRRADLVTTDPSATQPEDIDALVQAGFSAAGIVSLSQVIAFVSYQIRFVALLRALGGAR